MNLSTSQPASWRAFVWLRSAWKAYGVLWASQESVSTTTQVLERLRRAASEGVLDRLGVVEAAEHRLAQGARELVVVQDVREVGERPRRTGHRDAPVDGAVRHAEIRPVRGDQLMPPAVPSRHLRPEQLTEADAQKVAALRCSTPPPRRTP